MIFTPTLILKNEIFDTRFITHVKMCCEWSSRSCVRLVAFSRVIECSCSFCALVVPPAVTDSPSTCNSLQHRRSDSTVQSKKPDRKTKILNSIRITHQPKWFLSPSKRKVRPSVSKCSIFTSYLYFNSARAPTRHLKTSQNSHFPIFLDDSFCLNVFTQITVETQKMKLTFSLSLSLSLPFLV